MNNHTTISPVTATSRPRRGSRLLLWLLVLWLVLAGVALLYRRPLLDWLSLRNYTPPAAISALALADTMTPTATHDFYVNHPTIDTKTVFTSHCNFGSEQSIVLGCYHSNQAGISLLDVTDPRLNGVEQVTAAHEMLHAAYDRLGSAERAHIDSLLQDFYTQHVTDTRVRVTIDLYRKTEPHDVTNEMHSIFGTEVLQLTPELEAYYQRYFTNRVAVAKFAAAYSSEFTGRQQQVASYDAQLKALKATIDANTNSLASQQANLQAMHSQLDAERGNDPAQYNQEVASYNAQVNAYNAQIVTTRSLITRYNELLDLRNRIALQEQELARAISGDSVPAAR